MPGFADARAPSYPVERPVLGVVRSLTGRAWMLRLDVRGEAVATAMAQRGLASPALARVLAGRGVELDAVAAFLAPSLRASLPDPSTLTDMDAAATRLADAVAAGRQVAIFGDYDVDGATSAALLDRTLRALGCPTRIYIPDRVLEGYGPNPAAMDELADGGAALIVCVDCGSTGHEALARAAARDVDVVVLDHHQVGVELPKALALVNPNRLDDVSGQGRLAAVGVTFLACVALLRELRRRSWPGLLPDLLAALDLVALGTVCDMVPLAGVNRAFVTKGLVALRHAERPGVRALAAAARLKGPPDAGHLGFLLGPRVNAGGRIGGSTLGARLLATDDPAEAERIAALLDRMNVERQQIEREAVDTAVAEAERRIAHADPPVLVIGRDGWHPGVVGLVASRLKERFCRPAVAIAWTGESGSGSARSITGIDVGAAVRAAVDAGLLVKGGGHAMAAGLTLSRDKLDAFEVFLAARIGPAVIAAAADRVLDIDAVLSAGGATLDAIAELDRAGPFGIGNPAPVVALPAHRVVDVGRVGAAHVRLVLEGGGATLKAMAFRAADTELGAALLASRGQPLHVTGTLCVDHWNGSTRPQLRVTDAARAEGRV